HVEPPRPRDRRSWGPRPRPRYARVRLSGKRTALICRTGYAGFGGDWLNSSISAPRARTVVHFTCVGGRVARRLSTNHRTPFHESLRSHDGHRLCTPHAGPSVAHCRGRTAPPGKPFVGRDHGRCRRSVGLGLAPPAAIAAHVRHAERGPDVTGAPLRRHANRPQA